MKRREFIKSSILLLSYPLYGQKSLPSAWEIIYPTLDHIFPKTKNFAGASVLNIDNFIKNLSKVRNPDHEIVEFFIDGAKQLYNFNKEYLLLTPSQREIVLRDFEKTNQQWLSSLIYYGLEGMLGDPIYGGNKKMLGWDNLSHNPGQPRPEVIYGAIDV